MKRLTAIVLIIAMLLVSSVTVFANNRTQDILSGMSLEEKVGQMIMPAFRYWGSKKLTEINDSISKAITDLGLGGVILFAENTQTTAQTARLVADMQEAAINSKSKVPLFVSIDQEGGYIYRLGTGTSMCGNMALGASGKPENARLAADVIGKELKALGFNIDFAPVMDVNNNPNNPVIGVRSFSDDANEVAKFGSAYINGLSDNTIISSLKHFPGHGDTETDSHTGLPCINKTLKELEKCELIPFKAGIQAGADMVMTAHIQYPKIETKTYTSIESGEKVYLPATLSKTMITDILRNKLGFKGVVCTDSMQMDAVSKNFDAMDAARLAINAGADILLMPVNIIDDDGIAKLGEYINGIVSMVKEGKISEKTIDAAALRILSLKENKGILDTKVDKASQVANALSIVGSKENHDLEWEITQKGITLIKNDGALPIKLNKNEGAVLFASYANEVTEAEFAAEKLAKEELISSSSDLKAYSYQKMNELSDEQKQLVLNAKTVIVSVESAKSWELEFANELIEFAHSNGKKVTLISLQLPYDLASYKEADALIAAYNCKGMNEKPVSFSGETKSYGPNMAVAITACFCEFEPTGKLPVTVPNLADRGFGLNGYMPFTDVPSDAYYRKAVYWAIENQVTSGLSKTIFGANSPCTRVEAVTFLWRFAGCPSSDYEISYIDVKDTQYYYEAVKWAASNNIEVAKSETALGYADSVTREEFATMLYRYAKLQGKGFTGDWMFLLNYKDAANISSFANEAMHWCVMKGILNGKAGLMEGMLDPQGELTRAEACAMIQRFADFI